MDLENFWPISKSRKQMGLEVSFSGDFWASESRILMPTGLGVSDLSRFVLFFLFRSSGVDVFRVYVCHSLPN